LSPKPKGSAWVVRELHFKSKGTRRLKQKKSDSENQSLVVIKKYCQPTGESRNPGERSVGGEKSTLEAKGGTGGGVSTRK